MKIYLAKFIKDMSQGCGPYIPECAFIYREHAENYINQQPGVQGRKYKWTESGHNDWIIKEIDVYDFDITSTVDEQTYNILNKLTLHEREILGLEDTISIRE